MSGGKFDKWGCDVNDERRRRTMAARVGVALAVVATVISACAAAGSPSAATGGGDPTDAPAGSGNGPAASTGGSIAASETVGATPTPSPNPTPTPSPTPTLQTSGALTFELDLVGAVPQSDRYKVELTIDGETQVHGFCGFQDVCSADLSYTWFIGSVDFGSELSWFYRREGNTNTSFADGVDNPFDASRIIKARCIFNPNNNTETCERTQ